MHIKKATRVILSASLLLALLIPAFIFLHVRAQTSAAIAVTPGVTSSSFDPSALDEYVVSYMRRSGVPGVAVAVTKNGTVLYTAGFGTDGSGKSVTSATLFPIASLSKSFTALALMQLVEEGKVSLDAPVHTYVPDFYLADPRGTDITVRELLDQTSGMSDMVFPEKSLPQPGSLAQAVARLHTARLASAPGTVWHYHNPNYQVLARLVEIVSGEPFPRYMAQHVFIPLGMRASYAVSRVDEMTGTIPDGFIHAYGMTIALPEPPWFQAGASGVITSADDMAKWLLLQNGAGSSVITRASLDAMHSPKQGASYAFGWIRSGNAVAPRISHYGWMFTYTADAVLLPASGYGIAIMTNGGLTLAPTDSDTLSRGIEQLLTKGSAPQAGIFIQTITDTIIAELTLLVLVLAMLAIMHANVRRQRRRSLWRLLLTLCLPIVPVVVCVAYPYIMTILAGRDATWQEFSYVSFPLAVLICVAAFSGFAVITTSLYRFFIAARSRER